jgi:hypothetical protein
LLSMVATQNFLHQAIKELHHVFFDNRDHA